MKHSLKISPAYFEAVETGGKNFEIRDNKDRGFQKGDIVELNEYRAAHEKGFGVSSGYTGRMLVREITYVTNYEQKEGFVVFGMKEIS